MRFLACAAIVALLAARVWFAFTLRVNSDEPQNLHVVWSWLQGVLPYRDLFDNHAPLFHILHAPLLALFGERADIVPLMRLTVIPWYALTVWLAWRLAKALFDERIGIAAAGLTALFPTFFTRSIEFRPDDAWAAAWTAALVVAIGRAEAPSRRRAFQCGLLGGLAVAFSIKSGVLIAATLLATTIVMIALALQGRRPRWRTIQHLAVATAAGGIVLPAVIVVVFSAAGAFEAMRYCLIVHNAALGLGRWPHLGWAALAFPLLLPAFVLVTSRALAGAENSTRTAWRAWLLNAALLYLALRGSYQPLLDKQDLLPVVPMLAPFAAALFLLPRSRLAAVFVAGALALELAITLAHNPPWRDRARIYGTELHALLTLSTPNDFVMDDKAESIFRSRPVYWVLENVTQYRLARGLIADDIAGRLVANHVGVGVFEHEPGADQAFVRRNYVSVAPHIEVAGQLLGEADRGVRLDFDVAVPDRYAILASDGNAAGLLDGSPYLVPRELGPGRHEFVPARRSVWALELARAAALGYRPFGHGGSP